MRITVLAKRTLCRGLVLAVLSSMVLTGCYTLQETATGQSRLEFLQPKAEAGDAEAQFLLGNFYSTGFDWPRDYNKALYWYTKSAEQGYVRAQVYLGLVWEKGLGDIKPDRGKAFHWYSKAAEQGNAQALAFMGRAYQKGIGVGKDLELSRKYFLQAANLGEGRAQFWAGRYLHRGKGGPKDLIEARKWFLLAIEHIVDGPMISEAKGRARSIEKLLSDEDNQEVLRRVAAFLSTDK